MPFPIALLPWILGAGATAGTILTNRSNQKFQERMSNTAARRAAEDYRKAGLNPALAYDRAASSPATTISDPIGPGISSALGAKLMIAELAKKKMETKATDQLGELYRTQKAREGQNVLFDQINQPLTLRIQRANALVNEASIPEAENIANMQKGKLGKLSPYLNVLLNSGKSITQMIRGAGGR